MSLSLAPVAAIFLCFAVEPLGFVAGETRRAALLAAAAASASLLLERSLDASLVRWVWQVSIQIICVVYNQDEHSILLNLLSMVVVPITLVASSARTSSADFLLHLVVHFLVACVHFRDALADKGWQWLSLLLVCDVVYYGIYASLQPAQGGSTGEGSTDQVLQTILGTVCDGCLLLKSDGTIMSGDDKASDLLDMESGANGDASMPKVGAVLPGVLEGGVLSAGARMLRPKTRDGKRKKIEAYIIPLSMEPEVAHELARCTIGTPSKPGTGPVYLCALREMEMSLSRATSNMAGDEDDEDVHLSPTTSGGSSQGRVIRATSHVASDMGMTQAASAVAGPAGHPGISINMLDNFGLGVGTYTKMCVVGRGTQGSVWQVKSEDGTIYAQKDIALKGKLWARDFPIRLRDADREVRALKGLTWASCVVVPIVDCWMSKDFETSCIVMEWMPRNMFDVLKNRRTQSLGQVPVPQATEWIGRLAAGLMAIHSARFIHRDIKPANVLLDENLKFCKISDLGVSRALHSVREFNDGASGVSGAQSSMVSDNVGSILSGYTVRPGTVAYTSPEARENGNYGCATDVYSLGILVLEILTLKPPNEVQLGKELDFSDVRNHAKMLLRSNANASSDWAELAAICMEMLAPERERPQAADIAARPVLRLVMQDLVSQCKRLGELLKGANASSSMSPMPKQSPLQRRQR